MMKIAMMKIIILLIELYIGGLIGRDSSSLEDKTVCHDSPVPLVNLLPENQEAHSISTL